MTAFYIIIAILPIIALGTIFTLSIKQKSKGLAGKKVLARNLASFALVLITICALTFTVSAATANEAADTASAPTAQSETAEEKSQTSDLSEGMKYIAAAIVTCVSGIGGGIAVAAAAPAAIAATSENDKAFGKSLIFVALGESIALYGVVISILILNN
ncbi:MAG: hypothetical protein KBT46_02390 [Ruminococcus sp.]|nr:hypothetical protein [Candidatus Copronaster equi]